MIKNYPFQPSRLSNNKLPGVIFTLALLLSFSVTAYTQAVQAPLVVLSGSGETTYAPINGSDFSHHINYTMNIRSITDKWNLTTLMGEPVIDGVFKWQE